MFGGLGRILAALGKHSVDVYEWTQTDIRKVRLPNGPKWADLAQPRPKLHFTGWQLAHAVVKADYLVEWDLLLPGLGLLLQVDRIIDFHAGDNLRLVPGSSAVLNDFTRTSLSGRLGQGVSLLFAQNQGFIFSGHLASDPLVSSHLASLPGKTRKVADFLFESQTTQRMILESKGSFSQPKNDPTKIKSTLRAALTGQVDYWMPKITPQASKGFAVYSCFRETGNPARSALIFVDSPGQDGRQPIELPESWVRRRNYAAWLTVMGLDEVASSLRSGERRDRRAFDLPIIRIGTRLFAVSPLFAPEKRGRWLCAGLDVSVLGAIGAALDNDEQHLMAFDGGTKDDAATASPFERNGSIFADGSFFGAFDEAADFQGYKQFLL